MKVERSSGKEMASFKEAVAIVRGLAPVDCSPEEWFDFLDDTTTIWKVYNEDEVWGFYTISQEGFYGEGHAYIFKAHRRHSKRILRLMVKQVQAMGLLPKTTATSDFPHVVKFLKMLGFTEVGVEKDGIVKPKGSVDVYYFLYLTK